jgi:signal transduction histidine kinase
MLAALRQAVQLKLGEMAQAIRQRDEAPMHAAVATLASDAGIEQMKAIFLRTDELLALEAKQGVAHGAALQRTLELSRVGVISLCVIGLLALFLYLRHGLALQSHELDLKRTAQVERERLEAEVIQRTAQLTDLTRHLLSAREDERNRLARDLHDELGSLLTSAKLDAARIKSRLGDAAPEALERLAHLVGTLNSSIALGRRIIEDLRPSTLANLGLAAALEILAREYSERSGVQVDCTLEPVRLSSAGDLVIYRVVQEAITNVSKYARARRVWITLNLRGDQVEASVRDDGVGFDTRQTPSSAFGLLGMRYRVEAERGTLTVASAPGQGTTISVVMPAPG